MVLTVAELQVGDRARVVGFHPGDRAYRQKLLAMGLTPNAEFLVVRHAPLGDPVQLRVRHTDLCLRKAEAGLLKIEKLVE